MDTCPHTLDIPHDKEAALNALEEKERLSIAMSSYYMLYRQKQNALVITRRCGITKALFVVIVPAGYCKLWQRRWR